MFDIDTGIVSFGSIILEKGDTREAFLTTNVGVSAQLVVENQSWSTYEFSSDEKAFFAVQFKNGVIEQIYIAFALNGNDRNTWTAAAEVSRKSLHDQMLRKEIGAPPYLFSWGRIESVIDPRSGASQIIVTYA
jgi:hypothetical protein